MHISFFNPQGNFDRDDSRWVSHPDFGGQLVYVKELGVAMARMGHKVDIITRQIIDDKWPEFAAAEDAYEGLDNLRIIRIPFGPEKFLNKELLWPHLIPGYVEGIISFYEKEGSMPDAVTSHYGDGGLAAAYFKERTGIPFTFTGHSLGAQKMDKLRVSLHNYLQMEEAYNFSMRLLGERAAISNADRIITSTSQERYSQYTHTAYQDAVFADDDKKFSIIPPGVSLKIFDKNIPLSPASGAFLGNILKRDISPERLKLPAVISSSRLDPKKNISALVRAFGESDTLQEEANLIIVTRGFENPLKDFEELPGTREGAVLQELISLVDTYNLRGKVSMISIEKQENLAHMYRYFAQRRSVFCLSAIYEPFGLAPLEAMAAGLPAVVTKFGGPGESLRDGDKDFGILVDPGNTGEMAGALHSLVSNSEKWAHFAKVGYSRVLDKFTWDKTAEGYIKNIENMLEELYSESLINLSIHPWFISPEEEEKPGGDDLFDLYLRLNVLCAGEAVVYFISKKQTNSLIDAEEFSRYLGGNPASVAVYLSRFGKKSALITKLGRGHFASFIENELSKYGVSTEHIRYTERDDTSVEFLSHTPSEPDFQSMHSADRNLSIKDIEAEVVERADIIFTSASSLAEETARSAIRKVLRIAKKSGKITALDPNYNPGRWQDKEEALEVIAQISYGMSIVKPSISDARYLFDYNMPEDELARHCIDTFHEWGASVVVLTSGGKYVIVSDSSGNEFKVTDLTPVDIVDATGAGRAFMAGFLAGYHDALALEKCVRLGHHAASIALKTIGPVPDLLSAREIFEGVRRIRNS